MPDGSANNRFCGGGQRWRNPETPVGAIKGLSFVASLFLFAMPIAAQSDITGFWVFRGPPPDGNIRESFFDLKLDGQTVTGNAVQDTRQIPISKGNFQDGVFHF